MAAKSTAFVAGHRGETPLWRRCATWWVSEQENHFLDNTTSCEEALHKLYSFDLHHEWSRSLCLILSHIDGSDGHFVYQCKTFPFFLKKKPSENKLMHYSLTRGGRERPHWIISKATDQDMAGIPRSLHCLHKSSRKFWLCDRMRTQNWLPVWAQPCI